MTAFFNLEYLEFVVRFCRLLHQLVKLSNKVEYR